MVFPNPRLCKALLDRITDRAHIIGPGNRAAKLRSLRGHGEKTPEAEQNHGLKVGQIRLSMQPQQPHSFVDLPQVEP
jgi:hypothetical protein